MTYEERFWLKVHRGDGCWEWHGCRLSQEPKRNYGIAWNGYDIRAHRYSWELTNGPVPAGMHVLHRCDNPPCVRPDHLFLGTQGDNLRDAVEKGRLDLAAAARSHNEKNRARQSGWIAGKGAS